jgi:diguanylate cyclase (GGDEF)-like protein
MLDEIGRRTGEVAPLFEVPVASEPFDSILRKANERLVELTLTTQRQSAKLQAQATNLKRAATQLKAQNNQLREQAVTDALTGLSNRGTFDQFFTERFGSALMGSKTLAILMMDVDHFKQINDQHGHQAGDAVLQSLAEVIGRRTRVGDLAARYGGEEFVLVLPNTPRQQAAALAEGIRRDIAARVVRFNQKEIPATVSIGVAAFEPGGQFREATQLLQAADLAVYAAKKAGRNCVRVYASSAAASAA